MSEKEKAKKNWLLSEIQRLYNKEIKLKKNAFFQEKIYTLKFTMWGIKPKNQKNVRNKEMTKIIDFSIMTSLGQHLRNKVLSTPDQCLNGIVNILKLQLSESEPFLSSEKTLKETSDDILNDAGHQQRNYF
jgi:hypothetical protein